jgi:hypothetical protein
MRRACFVLALAALVLAGCADENPTVRWSRPDTAYDQFVADRDACVRQTLDRSHAFMLAGQRYGGRSDVLDAGLFVPCMTARGYKEDPKGYAVPPGDEMPMSP